MVYTWTMNCCIVGLRIGLIALTLLLICQFFLTFKSKFVPRFSHELFKLESSIMECICTKCDHVVALRYEVIGILLLFFLSIFLPILHVSIENLCQFPWELFKLES